MNYLTNAFSLNMLTPEDHTLSLIVVSEREAREIVAEASFMSAVGHEDTAALLTEALGVHVAHSRMAVSFRAGDAMLVAQYTGPRLPEGARELPPGARFVYWMVKHFNGAEE